LRVARKGDNEFALSLIGHESREAMTRRIFSERYGKPIDQISASQALLRRNSSAPPLGRSGEFWKTPASS
jgi:hypothetical protein